MSLLLRTLSSHCIITTLANVEGCITFECRVLINQPHPKHEWKQSWIFHKFYMYIYHLPTCSSSLLDDLLSTCVVNTVSVTSVPRPGCSLVQLLSGSLHLIFSHYTIMCVKQPMESAYIPLTCTLFNLDSLQVIAWYMTNNDNVCVVRV